MPKLLHALSQYRKHRVTGQAIVEFGGRTHYLGPHGTKTSRRKYDRLVGEWIAAGRPSSRVATSSDLAIAELLRNYWQFAKTHYVKHGRPTDEQDCTRAALRFVKELYADTPAAEFSPLKFKAVRQRMIDAGWSRTTVTKWTPNVLFEGGAGETVRRNLLKQCDVHTLLRLPTGIFYAQGVKANVLFLDAKPAQEKPWTKTLWVYDLRTNMHFTQKTNPLRRADLDEFVGCYRPGKRHLRKPMWSETNADGRWRPFDYDDLMKRDKVNLDIFWLRDKSLEDSDDLPPPDVLAQEIADDLQAALEQFTAIAEKLKS